MLRSQEYTIGLSMIVRNAGATVQDALLSCAEIMEQIVIVDTGSEDNTSSLCTRFGAETHFLLWQDDFSYARNHALAFMRTDWILQLDADETIYNPSDWLAFINSIHKQDSVGGARIRIHNELEDKETSSSHTYTRLYRRNSSFAYEGAIHEQIAPSILIAGYEITDSDLKIIHSGYSGKNQEKESRNRRILEKELLRSPDDPFLLYHNGNTLFAQGDYKAAREYFENVYANDKLSNDQQENVRLRLAQIAISESEYEKANTYLSTECLSDDNEGFRHYLIGSIEAISGRYESAMKHFSDSLNSKTVNKSTVENFIHQIEQIRGKY